MVGERVECSLRHRFNNEEAALTINRFLMTEMNKGATQKSAELFREKSATRALLGGRQATNGSSADIFFSAQNSIRTDDRLQGTVRQTVEFVTQPVSRWARSDSERASQSRTQGSKQAVS